MTVFEDIKAISRDSLESTCTAAIVAAGAENERLGARPGPRVTCFQSDLAPYPWTFEASISWHNPDIIPFFASGTFSDLYVAGDGPHHSCFRVLLYVLRIHGY